MKANIKELIRSTMSNSELVREKQQQDKDDKDKQAWAATTVFYNDPHAAGIVYCSTSHGKDFYKFHEQLKRWVRFNRASIGVHLKIEHGLSTTKLSGVEYSSLDVAMLALEDSCEVTLATTLAGHFAGVEQGIDKMPILITSSPNLVAGRQGEWPLWQTLLHEALCDQFDYFWGSLALARQNLWKKCFAPQRAQVLAGAAGCGKTLIQRRLVTPLLGGRVASPYEYMTKSTNFNADMVTSEHLCLDDDNPHYDKRSRETFGNMIKKVVATPDHALHPKGVDKQMVKVAWFMTISVNDSPHALQILPIFDEALLEKVCLYKLVKPPSISYPTSTGAMETFNAQLDAELPAIAYALDTYEIPEQLREERYMIKASPTKRSTP